MHEANSRQTAAATLVWSDASTRFVSPCFDAVRLQLDELDSGEWPDLAELNRLAVQYRLENHAGMQVRFVAPGDDESAALHYETRIAQKGLVATRESWHDLFNALQWLTFPKSKAAISAAHARMLAAQGNNASKTRSVSRDVLTLFDEGGLIICSADPALLQLVREFKWRELFVDHRDALRANMRFYLAGHSVLEKMLAPFIGITAKAMLVDVDQDFLQQATDAQVASADTIAARWLQDDANLLSTRNLHPVPILGVPGWDARNASPDFYANADYFRGGYTRDGKR